MEELCHVRPKDSVVGRVKRDEANMNGTLHRAGMVFLKRPDGQIIPTKRNLLKETFPDTYDCSAPSA